MKAIKDEGAQQLREERDFLYRELIGTQEMLAQVLAVTGTVEVPKESVSSKVVEGKTIQVDDDAQSEVFRFSLVDVDEEGNVVE